MVKNPLSNAGDISSTPGSERSPGEENGNPFQYPCWKIPRTEKPAGLQWVYKRVEHDLSAKQQLSN